jgi:ribonuclease G
MQTEKLIVVNVDYGETRVALIEDGIIVELLVERRNQRSLVGNVYRGQVTRVLPGMQAAFVDIGLERNAFLHASDLVSPEELDPLPNGEGDKKHRPDRHKSIRDIIKEGEGIAVQVSKDPIGSKGSRVTADVSLPGRHLVYMPFSDRGGISRRISDEGERKRLGRVLRQIELERGALIARTAAEGVDGAALTADATYLAETWQEVLARFSRSKRPGLLYEELELPLRVVRDYLDPSVGKLVVDDARTAEALRSFIGRLIPELVDTVEVYEGEEPIFDAFGIESEIRRALERVVELPSGGTLVIDQGEALTAVDVNTGKFVGKGSRDQEETIFRANLEAVDEIAYQVRFRNIGGLIVLDLIDMDRPANRKRVADRLKEAMHNDRAKNSVMEISRFGLLEMTRERTRESLGRTLHERCEYCDGTGHTLSRVTVANEVLREIRRRHDELPGAEIEVRLHPHVAEVLAGEGAGPLAALCRDIARQVVLTTDRSLHLEKYQVRARRGPPGREDP